MSCTIKNSLDKLPGNIQSQVHSFLKTDDHRSLQILSTKMKNAFSSIGYNGYFLDCTQRPQGLRDRIDQAFGKLAKKVGSHWGVYNGAKIYGMCGVNEMQLIQKIIEDNPTRKNFYVMDVGAGDFSWSQGVIKELEEILEKYNCELDIFSLRGERNDHPSTSSIKHCHIHNLGQFKIEEIATEFAKQKNTFDLVISCWCMRHLADPVGTFAQIYNLIRPSGFFIFDGFYFMTQEKPDPSNYISPNLSNSHVIALLNDLNVPFLMKHHDATRSLNHFIVQKPNNFPCLLPMRYHSCERIEDRQVASETITKFQRKGPPAKSLEKQFAWTCNYSVLSGDLRLFQFLKSSGILSKRSGEEHSCIRWFPPFEKQGDQIKERLFNAIRLNDQQTLKEIIASGLWMDFKTEDDSPFMYSISQNNMAVAEMLLTEHQDPLNVAIEADENGSFIKLALNHQYGNPKAFLFHDRLNEARKDAIRIGNTKAAELIQEHLDSAASPDTAADLEGDDDQHS